MKNLISKNEFCEIMRQLRGAKDLQDQVSELYRNSECNRAHDFCNYGALQINHESVVIDLLRHIFNDKNDNISYFVYELDFGRKYMPGKIYYYDEDKKPVEIDFSTEEALYDYLVEIIESGEDK